MEKKFDVIGFGDPFQDLDIQLSKLPETNVNMRMTGCVLGTLLIVLVENSMILIGVPVVWKDVFVGLLIVIGTAVSAYQATHSGTKRRTRTQAKEAQHNG